MKNKFLIGFVVLLLAFSLVGAKDFVVRNVSDSTNNYFVVNGTTGNVGIGVGNPSVKLFVSGNTRFNGTGLFDGSLTTYGNLVTASRLTSNFGANINDNGFDSDTLIRGLNDNNLFFVDASTDRIGIGTNIPTSKLQINSAISDGIILRTTTNAEPFIAMQRNNGANGVGVFRLSDGGSLYFDNGAIGSSQSTKMTILSSGNVGIGTTIPTSTLQVRATGDSATWGGFNFIPVISSSASSNIIRVGAVDQSISRGLDLQIFDTADGSADAQIKLRFGSADAQGKILFDTSGTERMRIDENGKVGINTTTPQNTLNVVGDANFTGNIYSNGQLIGSGELNSTGWNRSGTNVFLANSGDKVGIGTTNPSIKFTVIESAGSTPVAYFENTNSSYSSTSLVKIKGNGGPTTGSFLFDIVRGSTPILNARWDGNVGIGTISPNFKLEVSGDAKISSKLGIGTSDQIAVFNVLGGGTTDSTYAVNIRRQGGNRLFAVQDGGTVTIPSGNLGIGTSNPSKKLEVAGDIAISAGGVIGQGNSYGTPANTYDGFLKLYDGSTGYTTLQSASAYGLLLNPNGGNVGIGTSNPNQKLVIGDDIGSITSSPAIVIGDTRSGYGGAIILAHNISQYNYIAYDSVNKGVTFRPEGGSSALFIKDMGNIGIGTSTPQNELNVVGNINATGSIYQNGKSLDNTYIKNTGDNATGEYNFDGGWQSGGVSIIGGNLYTQALYAYNINSLAVSNLNVNGSIVPPSGFDNQFDIGNQTFRWRNGYFGGDLTVDGTINVNVSGGINPGFTTGSVVFSDASGLAEDNSNLFYDDTNNRLGIGTIIPGYKLDVNGSINIADGSYYKYGGQNALRLAKGTDVFYANTYVGLSAGNPSSTKQTAIGYVAGYLNTGASQTAIGYHAGRQNTGASQTALGYYAGYLNTGVSQTAIGMYAGYLNTGTSQTAIGYVAGYLNTGASQTALGYYAGRQNTGNQVIGIGHEATRSNIANDVVAIGYQAGKSNTVANQFIVKQANINAVPLIQGDFATGNVGIGTTSPGAKLDVVGSSVYVSSITSNSFIEDKSGILAGNYIPSHSWNIGIGGVDIFSKNGDYTENVREWGVGPHGNNVILWKAVPDAISGADGGWGTLYFTVDNTKMYRFSVWIKKTGSVDGTTYLGTGGGTAPVTYLSGTANTNPYFFASDLPSLNKWYLLVGYVHGSGDSSTTNYGGVYDGVTGEKVSSMTDFKMQTTTTGLDQRSYLYYDTTITDRQYWWDPRMEEVNGQEPTINSLLGAASGAAGSGTINYITKWKNSDTLGNSVIYNDGTNVGIGTINPNTTLHTVGATGTTIEDTTTNDNNILVLNQRNGYAAGARNMLSFSQGTTPSTNVRIGWDYDTQSFQIRNDSDVAVFAVTRVGNIGIGTTNPGAKLEVSDGTTPSSDVSIKIDSSGSTTYNSYLDLKANKPTSTLSGGLRIFNGGGATPFAQIVGKTASSDTTGSLEFYTSNSDRMTINSVGNVGIGTTDPASYKLNVAGAGAKLRVGPTYNPTDRDYVDIIAHGSDTRVTSSNERFHIENIGGPLILQGSSGNVGIGTVNPSAKLDVSGSVKQNKIKTYVIDGLAASGTQAKRFEIARATINYNNWNSGTGPIIIELFENYFDQGNYKKYIVDWGYNNQYNIHLTEYNGVSDANNIMVNVGSPVLISGSLYYLPIYIDVRYYSNYDVRITTNRLITTTNPPSVGHMYIDESPIGSNIADFTADSTVIQPSAFGATAYCDENGANCKAITSIGGDVVGPASSTDNAIVRFDAITGKLIQNSGVTIDDSGNIVTSGYLSGSSVRVTNIVTNKIVKFDGLDFDDSIMSDDGNTVNVAGKLVISDTASAPATGTVVVGSTGGNSNLVIKAAGTGNYAYQTFNQGGVGKFEMGITPTNSDFYINPNVQQGSTNAAIFIKKSNGNVGIGTTNPGELLTLQGSGVKSIKIISSNNAVYNTEIINRWDATNQMSLNVMGSELIGRHVGDTALMTGNVGIGTTSPMAKLDVKGNAFFDDTGTYTSTYSWAGGTVQTNSLEIMDVYGGSTSDGIYPTLNFHDYGNGGAQFSMEGSTTTLHLGSAATGSAGTLGTTGSYFSKLKVWGDIEATGTISGNIDADTLDNIDSTGFSRAFGTQTFASSTTTAAFIADLTNKGFFNYASASGKGSWNYAGNDDINDTGYGTFELAGTAIQTWTDGSSKTIMAIRPTTGAGGGQILVYNDQGSGYSPGWREIWTSTTDGSGSGLDADTLDGHDTSYFATAGSQGNYLPLAGGTMNSGSSIGINGGTTYGIGAHAGNKNSAYFDTVDSGFASDTLELNYYSGADVRIGPGSGTHNLHVPSGGLSVGSDDNIAAGYIQAYSGFVGSATANIGGTGDASYMPEGIYSVKHNWLYGGIDMGNGALAGVSTGSFSGTVTASSFTGAGTGLTGTASSLTSGNTLSINGAARSISGNTGTSYTYAVQIREANLGGSQGAGGPHNAYQPRLGFHWSGVVASSITMENSGRIAITNNPGTNYENFIANTITATGGFVGAISGTATNADLLDNLDSLQFLRSDTDDTFSGALISTSRNSGVFGTYDSYKTDQIWSMGAAYRNAADGSNFGNLYGLAYKHTNNPTGGTMGGGHQMVWVTNGGASGAIGESGIWTSGGFDSGNGFKKLGDAAVANGDTNSIPTSDQVYDFVDTFMNPGGAGDIFVEKAGDTMTGQLILGVNGLGLDRSKTNNAIWFNSGSDTNHVLWDDYYGGPTTRGAAGSGLDGIKWNSLAGWEFRTGSAGVTKRLVIDNANNYINLLNSNVGIGTTTPLRKLSVLGSVNIGNYEDEGLFLKGAGASTHYNWQIAQQENVDTALEFTPSTITGGTIFATPTMVLLQNGRVGIGTTSPLGDVGDLTLGSAAGSTYDGKLNLYGTTAGKYSTIKTTNGNLHIDADNSAGSYGIFLNLYGGSGGVNFGNGASAIVGSVSSIGEAKFNDKLKVNEGSYSKSGTLANGLVYCSAGVNFGSTTFVCTTPKIYYLDGGTYSNYAIGKSLINEQAACLALHGSYNTAVVGGSATSAFWSSTNMRWGTTGGLVLSTLTCNYV